MAGRREGEEFALAGPDHKAALARASATIPERSETDIQS